jgi:hypothetical protein
MNEEILELNSKLLDIFKIGYQLPDTREKRLEMKNKALDIISNIEDNNLISYIMFVVIHTADIICDNYNHILEYKALRYMYHRLSYINSFILFGENEYSQEKKERIEDINKTIYNTLFSNKEEIKLLNEILINWRNKK